MKNDPLLLWLDDPKATDATLVGPKAARLAMMHQAGLPVPAAFTLTTHAFMLGMSQEVEEALSEAYQTLISSPAHLLTTGASTVAVRSSATAEDMEAASFAGMQETVLNVMDKGQLLAAVDAVWTSVESPEAQSYRQQRGLKGSQMAVLVQQQVAAKVAGVTFGNDPITGGEVYIIEAVAGLGEQLVSGDVDPQRWRIMPPDDLNPEHGHSYLKLEFPKEPLLNEEAVTEVIRLLERATELFAAAQDIEWASDGQRLWMLQARPITTDAENCFTTELPDDQHLWCAGFLNERFTQPVSPLGWSMIAKPLERLALRGPLELLGADDISGPLLKLWRGHPYSRVEAWQRIYKLFFDWLLPDDAVRYFPAGDVSLRHAPRQPTYGLHLLWNGWRVLRQNFHAASPFHNPQAWAKYEKRQAAAMIRFHFAERQLAKEHDPIPSARQLLQEVADLTSDMLELHRWSLLYADISFSLLRRLLMMRYGATEGALRAVKLTTNVSTPTTEMNRILRDLAAQVAQNKEIYDISQALANGKASLDDKSESQASQIKSFLDDLRHFLKHYGHRFFSLDFYDAPWEADIPAFMRFLLTLSEADHSPSELSNSQSGNGRAAKAATPSPSRITIFLKSYMHLREAQRFYWQQLLALQRRLVLVMGNSWAARGQLAEAQHVFGLTWDELMSAKPNRERAAARMKRLHDLRAEARQAPAWHYPDFLRGRKALITDTTTMQGLKGRPVSPGIARGPARLITHPSDFEHLHPGDILVTTSPDPGWTPIFSSIAGLVTERGGQLSHGALIAREYKVPAVSGIAGLLGILRQGEMLLVDGTEGIVVRLDEVARAKDEA